MARIYNPTDTDLSFPITAGVFIELKSKSTVVVEEGDVLDKLLSTWKFLEVKEEKEKPAKKKTQEKKSKSKSKK